MGRLVYAGGKATLVLDDRPLRHLQLAIMTKLRHGESFTVTVAADHLPSGIGFHSLWISPAIRLEFDYSNPRTVPPVNRAWVELLVREASRPDGLHLLPEPVDSSSVS